MTGAHQKELAEAGISLACDDARQIAMRDAQRKNSHPQAGTSITPFGKISFGVTAYDAYCLFVL